MVFNKNILSWENSRRLIFSLQKRLFKSIYIGDIKVSLKLQKLILQSNSTRLLAIREVTQLSLNKKIAGSDGKTSLTFLERFELNEMLKINFNNWIPHSFKKIVFLKKDGNIGNFNISTISDRAWQSLIRFAIEPAHEALFHPTSYGFRLSYSLHDVQKAFFFNLNSESLGNQKRILSLNFKNSFISFNHNYLIKNIIAPRSVKFGIFRLFKKGLFLGFDEEKYESYGLTKLLSNILLDGIEDLHTCIRFGNSLVYFLKPFDNEKSVIYLVKNFLNLTGLNYLDLDINLYSPLEGFNFLGWNFKISFKKGFISTPSFDNYQKFLRRIKHIINNSNYGSSVKTSKIYPIIKDWKLYHKYSFMKSTRFSLFFVKKRAFRIFNNEARQDFYSTKILLDKSFYVVSSQDKKVFISPYYGHMIFWIGYSIFKFKNNFFCIHCGMNIF